VKTGNIGYKRRRQTKQTHIVLFSFDHYIFCRYRASEYPIDIFRLTLPVCSLLTMLCILSGRCERESRAGDVYTIQHYVIKFDSLSFSSTNKTDCHDITVVLLKVALKTLTLHITTYSHEPSFVIQHIGMGQFAGTLIITSPQPKKWFTSVLTFANTLRSEWTPWNLSTYDVERMLSNNLLLLRWYTQHWPLVFPLHNFSILFLS
jgi:hypothetical protein